MLKVQTCEFNVLDKFPQTHRHHARHTATWTGHYKAAPGSVPQHASPSIVPSDDLHKTSLKTVSNGFVKCSAYSVSRPGEIEGVTQSIIKGILSD